MNKKKWIILSIVIFLVLLVIGGIILFMRKNQTQAPISIGTEPTPTTTGVELLTWTDPAGFIFQYPKGIEIDKHDEDQENYAHLELSFKEHPGKIFVWAKDTTYPDMDAWIKGDKTLKNAASVETKLGTIEGKKIIVEVNGSKKIITGVITDEIIFTVEMEQGTDPFWDETYNTIIKAFTFEGEKPANDTTSQSLGEEEMSVDEEETIE